MNERRKRIREEEYEGIKRTIRKYQIEIEKEKEEIQNIEAKGPKQFSSEKEMREWCEENNSIGSLGCKFYSWERRNDLAKTVQQTDIRAHKAKIKRLQEKIVSANKKLEKLGKQIEIVNKKIIEEQTNM